MAKSNTLAIVVGIIGGGIATVVLVVAGGIILLLGSGSHGKSIPLKGGSELYYTPEVTRAEADKLSVYLNDQFVKEGNPKFSAQLTKANGVYQLRMVIQESKLKEAEVPFLALGYLISMEVFDKQPLEVHLCDSGFKTLKKLDIGSTKSAS